LGAMDLTSASKQASFTDAQATTAIKDGVKQNGKTTMKAFGGKLSDDDVKALVAYVRTLKKESERRVEFSERKNHETKNCLVTYHCPQLSRDRGRRGCERDLGRKLRL